MKNYTIFLGLILFVIGFIIMLVTGCDGYIENCWHGWDKLGILLCSLGVGLPFLVTIIFAIIQSILDKKK